MIVGFVNAANETYCEHDVGIRYSYSNSYGTGIAIKDKLEDRWLNETPAILTKNKSYEIKYYIDNYRDNFTSNVHIIVKLDSNILEEYDYEINNYHYNKVDLNISELECNSSHLISVEVQLEEDCNENNNYAERGIFVYCGEEPQEPICGNGIKEKDEECDDGNLMNEDGCSSACLIEYCGDGIIQSGLGEECDNKEENGIKCIPEYKKSCYYCSENCEIKIKDSNIGGTISVEEFKPVVWQCNKRFFFMKEQATIYLKEKNTLLM